MAYPGDEIDTEYIQNVHEFCVHNKELEDLIKKIPSVCSNLSGSEDAYEHFSGNESLGRYPMLQISPAVSYILMNADCTVRS